MALEYTCFIQGQWFEVPRTAEGLEAMPDELRRFVDDKTAHETLVRAAEALAQDVAQDSHPNRHTWGGVGDRSLGEISAVMTIEPVKARGVALDDFLTEWTTAEPAEGMDVWLRGYERKELSGRRAVSGREILQSPESASGQRRLSETYRAAITAPGLATYILMTITTDDLAVFDDIVGYGDILADTFEFSTVKDAA